MFSYVSGNESSYISGCDLPHSRNNNENNNINSNSNNNNNNNNCFY